jgi:hydroxymethylglutaryl-CoA reductase (NADPH)
MNLRTLPTVSSRRSALEKVCNVSLSHIGVAYADEHIASANHCENMIGTIQVPIGVAGPLQVTRVGGQGTSGEYYIPLATTEGALVASVNRGCKAISESGGVVVDSQKIGTTRGPVFRVKNLSDGRRLQDFLNTHFSDLQQVARQTSGHLTLASYTFQGVGKYRFVRFVFDTEDAMGMNMVTIATDALSSFIKEHTGISCLALSGNYCVDKKPSFLNFIEGRGTKAWAEVTIPQSVLLGVLKTTAERAYDVWLGKCVLGSVMSGSVSYNAQYANVVAALFLATGQDIAHVVEGSLGVTTAEVVDGKDLYVSVYIPDLMVGTIGGGTGLSGQKEALSLLGLSGGDGGEHKMRLAEVVAGAVLAGEISLLSSLEEGSLARAHKKLARGKVIREGIRDKE